MDTKIYQAIKQRKQHGVKSLAILVDPCKMNDRHTVRLAEYAAKARVDYLLVEGSPAVSDYYHQCVQVLQQHCNIPVMLFPGSPAEAVKQPDGLLCLPLINGPETIPTGYMVIGNGVPAAGYIAGTAPILPNKYDVAARTAMAGEKLGMQLIFMNMGSGARGSIPEEMVTRVAEKIAVPLLVGAGINQPEKAYRNCKAGADVIIAGNAIAKNNALIAEMAAAVHLA